MCWQCGDYFHTAMEVCPNDGARLIEASAKDQSDPLIGQVFDGRFRIYGKLGEGGMGTVYSARRLDFESDVALKLLKLDFARDDGVRKRFLYEARVISNLKHPHVVRLFDFGQTAEGYFYMVMELLDGESLADRLAYRFVSYREVFDIVSPICGVLGEAHTQDVIHRDLKPENIYLLKVEGNAEFPKLLDFGIAKHIRAETMTQSGTLWGTPAYMSPEQARGDVVGGGADVYAMGIIIYELVCGNLPFHATTQMGFAVKHINEPARPLSSIPGLEDIPPEFDAFVLRMLSKAPEDRPATMEEVASTLVRIKERCFDDALLDRIPAEGVEPLGLQQWIKAAQDMSQPIRSADNSAQHIPIASSRPDTDERNTLTVLNQAKTVAIEPSVFELDEEEQGSELSAAGWANRRAVVMSAAVVLLLVGLVLAIVTRGPAAEDVMGIAFEEIIGPVDMSNVTGAAAMYAVHVIVEARTMAGGLDSGSLIVVDEIEVVDRAGRVKPNRVRPASKGVATPLREQKSDEEEKNLRKALENTF